MSIEQLKIPSAYLCFLAQEFRDWTRLADGTGLAPATLGSLDHDVTVAQALRCVRNAMAMAREPDWYLRWGQRMAAHFHGPVTVAWLAAPTLGDGLDVFIRHMPARVPYFEWRATSGPGDEFACELEERSDLGACRAIAVEIPLMVMHEYVASIGGVPLAQARIELRHPPPAYRARYARWFRAEVRFDAPRNAFSIPAEWRAIRNAGHDEDTWRGAVRRLAEADATGERDPLRPLHQALSGLWPDGAGGGPPTLPLVAAELHVSPRTLIRRLRRAGTTYHAVVDGLQRQRACALLADPDLRICEVAAALGYNDPASFGRTFRRWFGTTPGRYRASASGSAAGGARNPRSYRSG